MNHVGAPKGSKNALGNSGGKSLQDRLKAAEARGLVLDFIIEIFKHGTRNDKMEMALRMAPSILPRLVEETGADGGALEVRLIDFTSKNK